MSESLNTSSMPDDAVSAFISLITKVATQGDRQEYLEHFKVHFSHANGTTPIRSSSTSWAESDLVAEMQESADNPPLFLEAFYDACEAIRRWPGDLFAPDAEIINGVCRQHGVGYELRPPKLVLRDPNATVVAVPERPETLADRSRELLTNSLGRSEELLEAGRGREAVQETLWLLETVSTAFKGIETGSGTIEGKYFNRIVGELRQIAPGTTLDRALEWASAVHGYLSSPTGGAVRHGVDLREGLELSENEARLFCNLVRSFLSYLLAEYERLALDQ